MNVQGVDFNLQTSTLNSSNSISSNCSSTILRNDSNRMKRISIENELDDAIINNHLSDIDPNRNGLEQTFVSQPTTTSTTIATDPTGNLSSTSTYRAAESVTQGISQLSPDLVRHAYDNGALIYANIDFCNDSVLADIVEGHKENNNNNNHNHNNNNNNITQSSLTRISLNQDLTSRPNGGYQAPIQQNNNNSINFDIDRMINQQSPHSPCATMNRNATRSKVGATIAMMNSLAAAANNQTQTQSQSQGQATGVLNGAIRQQYANNLNRQPVSGLANGFGRKQGPPKPPKPSMQQAARLYHQATAAAANANPNGLVMLSNGSSTPTTDDLAAEYSRLNFAERAELWTPNSITNPKGTSVLASRCENLSID